MKYITIWNATERKFESWILDDHGPTIGNPMTGERKEIAEMTGNAVEQKLNNQWVRFRPPDPKNELELSPAVTDAYIEELKNWLNANIGSHWRTKIFQVIAELLHLRQYVKTDPTITTTPTPDPGWRGDQAQAL